MGVYGRKNYVSLPNYSIDFKPFRGKIFLSCENLRVTENWTLSRLFLLFYFPFNSYFHVIVLVVAAILYFQILS